MGKVYLLDCTLRDGGYVNDWLFGENTIKNFGKKIALTGIEMFEVGFIKGDTYSKDRAVFPDIQSIREVIAPKQKGLLYVGMIDMGDMVPIERIIPYDGTSVDGLRIIFKKHKIDEAYEYCKAIKELGYTLFVQLVGTDCYTDKEFIEALEKFNSLKPFAVSIVDTFGLIKKKQFMRLVSLADNNLDPSIALGYHAHNNLQQAFGNAQTMVEMNLKRDICIDACVFGMGRGAGNLNLELFAEYMNENYGTNYRIEPMLEIMDEYLHEIYKTKFWGYSLPLYLSATAGCHPNYAIFFGEKNTLTEKSFYELLKGMSQEDKREFSKERAEHYYKLYQENFIDDKEAVEKLSKELDGRDVLLLAPGATIRKFKGEINDIIKEKNLKVIAVNFSTDMFPVDYVFSSNMRRYAQLQDCGYKKIITSNIKETDQFDYKLNFATYSSEIPEIIDNSGLMAIRFLIKIGVKNVYLAGMDGYKNCGDYFEDKLSYDFSTESPNRNELIKQDLMKLSSNINITFVTPSCYNKEGQWQKLLHLGK